MTSQAKYPCMILMLCFTFSGGSISYAQYEARTSLTGPEAAGQKKEARNVDPSRYNIKLGQFHFLFNAGLNQEYNDNVGLSQNKLETDFITMPHVGVEVLWPISQLNTLNLKFELAYAKYWDHPELDTKNVLLTPGSALDFNFYVGEIHFNVHDRIAILQDPVTISQLSGVSTFQRMDNTLGVGMEWDLNKVFLSGGFDHQTFESLENKFSSLDHSTDTLHMKAGVPIASQWTVGIFSSYSFTEYDKKLIQNGSSGYAVGTFADVIITEYLRGSASIGLQDTSYERTGTIADNTDFQSEIYSASLQNQLNQWLNHSIEFRRYTVLGIGSNFTDTYQIDYKVNAEVIRNVTSSLGFYYQQNKDSQSILAEKSTRYGITTQIGYQLFEPTRVNLGYQRTEKDSNQLTNDYEQNRVFLDIIHQF